MQIHFQRPRYILICSPRLLHEWVSVSSAPAFPSFSERALVRPESPFPQGSFFPRLWPSCTARSWQPVLRRVQSAGPWCSGLLVPSGTGEHSWPLHLCATLRAREWKQSNPMPGGAGLQCCTQAHHWRSPCPTWTCSRPCEQGNARAWCPTRPAASTRHGIQSPRDDSQTCKWGEHKRKDFFMPSVVKISPNSCSLWEYLNSQPVQANIHHEYQPALWLCPSSGHHDLELGRRVF